MMQTDLFEEALTSAEDALRFIYAGRAKFTVVSCKTGQRFTYKVDSPRDGSKSNKRFVRVLSGPDNDNDYIYIGFLVANEPGKMIAGKKGCPGHKGYSALLWVVKQLAAGHMPKDLEFYHAGRCGACGRTLTVPESIRTGLGPVCAEKG